MVQCIQILNSNNSTKMNIYAKSAFKLGPHFLRVWFAFGSLLVRFWFGIGSVLKQVEKMYKYALKLYNYTIFNSF